MDEEAMKGRKEKTTTRKRRRRRKGRRMSREVRSE